MIGIAGIEILSNLATLPDLLSNLKYSLTSH
jgi:hypothetical protein